MSEDIGAVIQGTLHIPGIPPRTPVINTLLFLDWTIRNHVFTPRYSIRNVVSLEEKSRHRSGTVSSHLARAIITSC
ncbi:MAG: hypothetical protein M8353_03315, partial [ANME-2 cluster archaeon]|nr:hypothetical protein [ANME-2 cluster archaeon]